MTKAVVCVALALSLGGCGVAARIDSRQQYQASVAAYKNCLAANAATPRNCEGLRLTMETDERQYNNLSAGLQGGQTSHNITVLQR